jgi:glycerol uptake facilitator-like aquaporin
MLMIVVMAVATDKRVVPGIAGFAVGSMVCLDATFGGPMTGASMNPAHSFGPALESGQWNHLWIYLVGPSLGCILAAKLYEWMAQGDASTIHLGAEFSFPEDPS